MKSPECMVFQASSQIPSSWAGPKTKKARAFGEAIYGPSKAFEKKKYGPGQHGQRRFTRHRFFNTNNLWLRLDRLRDLLDRNGGLIPLPVIQNSKTVNPRLPPSRRARSRS